MATYVKSGQKNKLNLGLSGIRQTLDWRLTLLLTVADD